MFHLPTCTFSLSSFFFMFVPNQGISAGSGFFPGHCLIQDLMACPGPSPGLRLPPLLCPADTRASFWFWEWTRFSITLRLLLPQNVLLQRLSAGSFSSLAVLLLQPSERPCTPLELASPRPAPPLRFLQSADHSEN